MLEGSSHYLGGKPVSDFWRKILPVRTQTWTVNTSGIICDPRWHTLQSSWWERCRRWCHTTIIATAITSAQLATGLEPGRKYWKNTSIFRSIRVIYIIINSILLFSESETSLMEHINSEEGDILGHKGTKTTHIVFLGGSAGDQNDTCIQLHKQDKGEPQMRWWRDRQKSHLQRLVTRYTRKSSRRTRDGVCASRTLAAILMCMHSMYMQSVTTGKGSNSNVFNNSSSILMQNSHTPFSSLLVTSIHVNSQHRILNNLLYKRLTSSSKQ